MLFSFYILLSLLSGGLALIIPQLIGGFVDLLTGLTARENAYQVLTLLFIVWAIQIALSYVYNILAVKLHTKTFFNMTAKIIAQAKRLSIQYFDKDSSAYFAQRINLDVANLLNFFLNTVLGVIMNVLLATFIIYVMFGINFFMSIVTLILIPVYIVIHLVMKRPLYKSTLALKESRDEFFSALNNQIMHIKNIKINSMIEETDKFLSVKYSPVITTAVKNAKMKQGYSISELLAKYFISIVVFIYSLNEIINNRMTVGEFTVLNTYVGMLVANISGVLTFGKIYEATSVSYNRLKEIIDGEEMTDGNIALLKINHMTIENLSFCYDESSDSAALYNNLNYTFSTGKIYAVTGDNGKGKSTMFLLLLGLIQNYKGRILYNDCDIRDVNMDVMRKENIAVVTQDLSFFYEKISENVNIVASEQKKANEYIKALHLSKFFNGIDEEVANLSLGEKQKLIILQALLKDADVILLDEPNSGLDMQSTNNLCDILLQEKMNKIIIIITHDKALMNIADERVCI